MHARTYPGRVLPYYPTRIPPIHMFSRSLLSAAVRGAGQQGALLAPHLRRCVDACGAVWGQERCLGSDHYPEAHRPEGCPLLLATHKPLPLSAL